MAHEGGVRRLLEAAGMDCSKAVPSSEPSSDGPGSATQAPPVATTVTIGPDGAEEAGGEGRSLCFPLVLYPEVAARLRKYKRNVLKADGRGLVPERTLLSVW